MTGCLSRVGHEIGIPGSGLTLDPCSGRILKFHTIGVPVAIGIQCSKRGGPSPPRRVVRSDEIIAGGMAGIATEHSSIRNLGNIRRIGGNIRQEDGRHNVQTSNEAQNHNTLHAFPPPHPHRLL